MLKILPYMYLLSNLIHFESINHLIVEKCSGIIKESNFTQKCFVIEAHKQGLGSFLTATKPLELVLGLVDQ